MKKLTRLAQVAVAWMFNLPAILFIYTGILLRAVAEWIYGSYTPMTGHYEYEQEGEISPEEVEYILDAISKYEDDDDKKVH